MSVRAEEIRTADLRRVVDERAACRGLEDPDVMFPHPRWDVGGLVEAAKVCAGCPVRSSCLELARRCGEEHGVWGGRLLTPEGDVPIGVEELEGVS